MALQRSAAARLDEIAGVAPPLGAPARRPNAAAAIGSITSAAPEFLDVPVEPALVAEAVDAARLPG
jgi:hypothetical protein